jgi:hypothetical protein
MRRTKALPRLGLDGGGTQACLFRGKIQCLSHYLRTIVKGMEAGAGHLGISRE